jgi:hypothetical protein
VTTSDDFEIIETPAPTLRLDEGHGDPYRDPEPLLPALRPGITIRWKDDKLILRVGIVMFVGVWSIAIVVAWTLLLCGYALDLVPLLGCTLAAIAIACLGRILWRDKHWVRADHRGLYWDAAAWTSSVIEKHLPTAEIAELIICDETGTDPDTVAFPDHVLYVRDRRGRRRAIADFDDPERAHWLQTRVEHHLGIEDVHE